VSAPFDGLKAIAEELSGMADVRTTLIARERRAEQNLAEAETELGALRKLRGFLDAEMARKRDVRRQIEEGTHRG
jgi:hypothetical protein